MKSFALVFFLTRGIVSGDKVDADIRGGYLEMGHQTNFKPKRTAVAVASRGFLATAQLSCYTWLHNTYKRGEDRGGGLRPYFYTRHLEFLQGVSVAVSPVLAIVGKPSVCLSVCPSHAGTV